MMTFVLAAAVLVGALCVAAALDGVTTEAPSRPRSHRRPRSLCPNDDGIFWPDGGERPQDRGDDDAGCPEGVAADLFGHDKPTMSYGLYAGGRSTQTRRDRLERAALYATDHH